MAKRIQPKLSHPRDQLISRALWAAATQEAISLLRNLYLADHADISPVLTNTREEYLADAHDAASTLVDYMVLHGTPVNDAVRIHIDTAVSWTRDEPHCGAYRTAAMAMVADLLVPARRAA